MTALAFQRFLKNPFLFTTSGNRCYSSLTLKHYLDPPEAELPQDFAFFPRFLDETEQRILLAAALRELDSRGSRLAKRNLKRNFKTKDIYSIETPTVQALFMPEESKCYDFEEGHYDGVIQHFREMHVTKWSTNLTLEPVLRRLRTLLPTTLSEDCILTHILHLASEGHILPHVDNTEASGSWVAAVSLGHERILNMEGPTSFQLLLPSGSAYVQRDTVRYTYRHSILKDASFKDNHIAPGQRLSVMLRVRPTTPLFVDRNPEYHAGPLPRGGPVKGSFERVIIP